MDPLKEFHFNSIYELAELVDGSVKNNVSFWNYNKDFFVRASCQFSKDTLLHLYIVTTSLNYYRRDIRKNEEFYEDEEDLKKFYDLFYTYKIKHKKHNFNHKTSVLNWFDTNETIFSELFEKMAGEVFYILFSNRGFLLSFNNTVAETIQENIYPSKYLTQKGTLKRATIPQWVKKAVYHREKGHCVFCNRDLTGLINIFNSSNYDHIVPLDLFGANDPCNIQLACESCNKSKTNKQGYTSNKYVPWWI